MQQHVVERPREQLVEQRRSHRRRIGTWGHHLGVRPGRCGFGIGSDTQRAGEGRQRASTGQAEQFGLFDRPAGEVVAQAAATSRP